MQQIDSLKPAADVLSIGIAGATLAAWLPPIAAFISIVWGLIRIYETETVREFLKKFSK